MKYLLSFYIILSLVSLYVSFYLPFDIGEGSIIMGALLSGILFLSSLTTKVKKMLPSGGLSVMLGILFFSSCFFAPMITTKDGLYMVIITAPLLIFFLLIAVFTTSDNNKPSINAAQQESAVLRNQIMDKKPVKSRKYLILTCLTFIGVPAWFLINHLFSLETKILGYGSLISLFFSFIPIVWVISTIRWAFSE